MQLDARMHGGSTIQANCTYAKMIRAGVYAAANLTPFVVAKTTDSYLATFVSYVFSNTVAAFISSQTHDYDDANELTTMNFNAQHLSFKDIVKKYGAENLSRIQIANLAEKFEQSYQSNTYSQITQEYPLGKILQYGLCPLTNVGFLHNKFIEEARRRKVDFISNLTIDANFRRIISNQMQEALVAIQRQLRELPDLRNTIKNIGDRFPDRTAEQNKRFEEGKERIPHEVSEFLHEFIRENTNKILNLRRNLNRALQELDIKYSERTEVQEKRFREREEKIPIEAHAFGQELAAKTSQITAARSVYECNARSKSFCGDSRSKSACRDTRSKSACGDARSKPRTGNRKPYRSTCRRGTCQPSSRTVTE